MTLADLLRAYAEAAQAAERPEVKSTATGTRFVALEDMTWQEGAVADAQQGVRSPSRPSLFKTTPSPDSFPTPGGK